MGMLGRLSTRLIQILLLNREMFESASRPMASHLWFKWRHHTHVGPSLLYNLPPRKKLNVMLKPLIEELKKLWQGFKAYDVKK
jgi:hypothetical protein